MPASPIDVIKPAFNHMVEQLFKPFRSGQWVRLAVTGLLAGELGGSGGCGARLPWVPTSGNDPDRLVQALPPASAWMFLIVPVVIALVLALAVGLIYVSSRMRFVLFDSVVNRECSIRRYWGQRGGPALRYFLFNLLYVVAMVAGIGLIVGAFAGLGFALEWWRNPRQHLLPIILAGIAFGLFLLVFLIVMALIGVLTKDFVVPQMALDDVSVGEGWRRLQAMMSADKANYAGFIGMKIVLTIGAAIVMGIATMITVLILGIPMAIIAVIAVLGGRALGLAWNIYTISLAITAGVLGGAVLLAAIFLISVPVVVFFPAYSLHFLAERYPPLNAQMHRSNL